MDKQKTQSEAFYQLGVAMAKFSLAMEENALAFWQGAHSVCKFRDKITRRMQFAIWILDTAERFADWVAGGNHD